MTWQLAEQLVDEVRNHLNATIGAKVTALNTEYGDSLLIDPKAIERSEIILDQVADWPVFVVIVGNYDIERWNDTFVDAVHELTVGVLALDQDTINLRNQLYRYTRAIWELLVDGHFDATVAWQMAEGAQPRVEFSPLFSSSDSRFISDARVIVSMIKQEARPA